MKVLIIGNGGREHAIAWKLAQESRITQIYIANGNAGTSFIRDAQNIGEKTIEGLLQFAQEHAIDLTIVGSEALLVEGIVDVFQQAGLKIFGADKQSAELEGSKRFAKDFMKKYGVKTADYASFSNLEEALFYLDNCDYPIVIKASGLASGKGVVICENREHAIETTYAIMRDKRFGCAGNEVVMERFLRGFECSILSFCDGETIALMQTAKDHKTIGENNQGENTGGMGVVSPHPAFTDAHLSAFKRDILEPTLKGIKGEKMNFSGVIFFGLMIQNDEVFLLEYNMRMGDPETQAVLPLMENSLLEVIELALEKRLTPDVFKFTGQTAVCVVGASAGYPNQFETGFEITGIEKAGFFARVFIAGAQLKSASPTNDLIKTNPPIVTSGGRVLNVVGVGDNLEDARNKAYSGLNQIEFTGKTFRRDIGL